MGGMEAIAPQPRRIELQENARSEPPPLVSYRGPRYSGYVHPLLRVPHLLLNEPERAACLPDAKLLLDCAGRQIVRLPLILENRQVYCFSYYFRNRSLQRSLRRCYAFRVLEASRRLRGEGLRTLSVLAAVRRNRQVLNRHSLIIASEIAGVAELSSIGNHRYHVHPQQEIDESLGADLARAVAEWHSRGFFHGDLKTRHILVSATSPRYFSFVDLEKTLHLPRAPRPFQDVLAARDLIQLFSSSPTTQSNPALWARLLQSYLAHRQLSPQRVQKLEGMVHLYGADGPFEQGKTLAGNLISWLQKSLHP